MEYETLKQAIKAKIDAHWEELFALNCRLFDHPEIGEREYESVKAIAQVLEGHGYAVEAPFDGIPTAFRAIAGENRHSHKAAVLVEYDALPEIGHACGHCLSGSISLLAGIAVKDLQDALDTDVHLIGTPAEETNGAKCAMAKDGVFDGYDMAIMVHMDSENLVVPRFQCLASHRYTFHGKAAHAAGAPWEGRNALNAVQIMFHAVDMLRQHVRPGIQFHGVVTNGGAAANIVPELAQCEMWIRTQRRAQMDELVDWVADCAQAGALATHTTWEREETAPIYYDLKPNPTGEAALREIYAELGRVVSEDSDTAFGSSDVGNVSYACPAFQPTIQVVAPGVAAHTREFAAAMKTDRAKEALVDGAQVIALQIAKIFSDPEKIRGIRADFARD